MTHRNVFLSILISLVCCTYSPITTASMTMPNMQDFEKELAEANRAIEEYVSGLSPAEQADFNRAVDEMSQMFENMSEDEFEKFLGEMFTDESMMMEPSPFDAIQPIQQEEVVEVVLSAEDKQKVETALVVLDDIIKQSNLFMVLITSSSELPNRISQWGKKGTIANWQNEATWDIFKEELETFIQKLYRSEEQDLTTKKYKYLLELIADEALYNNLIQLQTELKSLVPKINIPEFNIQKLSTESKKAIQNVLGKYTEAFYLLGIPKGLDDLFEKYAPEEEKIRMSEEDATRRALESARMGRTPATATEAGVDSTGYSNYYNPYSYDYGYYPSYDYGYSSPYDSGSYGNYDSYGPRSGSSRSGSGSGSSSGSGTAARGAGTGKTEASEKQSKEKEEKGKKSEKFTPNYEIDTAINDIKNGLKDIKAAMSKEEENPTKLTALVEHITNNAEPVDDTLASYILPTVVNKKISAMSDALEKITSKKLNPDDLAHYKKEVNKVFEANKKELMDLHEAINSFATQEDIDKAAKEAKKHIGIAQKKRTAVESLPKAKQWAYFGGDESLLSGNDVKLQDKIPAPTSLFDIKKNIDKLLANIKKFTAKKAEAPRPQPVAEPVAPIADLEKEE
jgi:hypothetical protein